MRAAGEIPKQRGCMPCPMMILITTSLFARISPPQRSGLEASPGFGGGLQSSSSGRFCSSLFARTHLINKEWVRCEGFLAAAGREEGECSPASSTDEQRNRRRKEAQSCELEASRPFPRTPSGRPYSWPGSALARSLQPVAGMRRAHSLGSSRHPSSQGSSNFQAGSKANGQRADFGRFRWHGSWAWGPIRA